MNNLECIIAGNRYGRYCVPTSSRHRPAAATILQGKVWEPETIAFMTRNCGRGDVIHAGTYFGDFLPALGQSLGWEGLVYAFEPSTENFRCAEITVELNGLDNVVLTNAALGARAGTLPLRIGEAGGARSLGGGSHLVRMKAAEFAHEDVAIVALDAVFPADRHVSILQLDVEGFEQQALSGALAIIRRSLPILVLECLPKDKAWFDASILALGYGQVAEVHGNKIFSVG